jgi:1-acyl-sn-glycerol-3-phosphate acyltransferase
VIGTNDESAGASGPFLFPIRTAAFIGLTLSMYGMLEVDTLTHDPSAREPILHKWIARYGRTLLALYGVEVIARGPYVEEGRVLPGVDASGRGRIFIMNHRSGLDIALSLAYVEATIVSRGDLAGWPLIGMAARRVGTLFVNRENKQSGVSVLNAMSAAVERGRGVLVYPEGTTFAGDEVRPFRAGAFSTALRTGAEIIPIGIAYAGAEATYVQDSFLKHMKHVSAIPRTRVGLVAGEPLKAEGSVRDLETRAHDVVQQLVHRARALAGGGPSHP